MARKLKEIEKSTLEERVKESFRLIGHNLTDKESALVLRLIISEIACYFFKNPDDFVQIGFVKIGKAPRKEELFNVEIVYNQEEGILNAKALNEFYKGKRLTQTKLKELMNSFVEELLNYSQAQELEVTQMTNKISSRVHSKGVEEQK